MKEKLRLAEQMQTTLYTDDTENGRGKKGTYMETSLRTSCTH